MIKERIVVVGLLLVALLGAAPATAEVDYNNPVRSAADDELTQLPKLSFKPTFRQYSGYLEADEKKPVSTFLHYWLVESQSAPDTDPLVLWLNGGPGCSSMLGLLSELGPFRVNDDLTIVENAHAWNKRANLLFIESPAFVGFSYALNNASTMPDDDMVAEQNYVALYSFFDKFPQFRKNELYLAGESYAGVYLTMLALRIDQESEVNLKGIALGNPYLNGNTLAESLVYFSYYHGLVGRSIWNGIAKSCCKGQEPARGQCEILLDEYSDECDDYVNLATDAIINSGVNPYNLYEECTIADGLRELAKSSPGDRFKWSRRNVDKKLMLSAFKVPNSTSSSKELKARDDPPCLGELKLVEYLNEPATRQALHVPEKLSAEFESCSTRIAYTLIYAERIDGLAPQVRQLIGSKRKLNLLIYNGDLDLTCNFFGNQWFVDDLGSKVIADYSPWYVGKQIAGYAKYFEGITYLTIKGAGHIVGADKPVEALDMFHKFLDGMKPPTRV